MENEIYGIAVATHETYFRGDKMQWLKENIEAIDWVECPGWKRKVAQYGVDDAIDADEPF